MNEIETILLEVFEQGNQLKNTIRTGWAQRGVPESESVAEHSYGVTFITLILAHNLNEPIDLGRALTMAILHDLPEALTTDIPSPAWRILPAESKYDVEKGAMTNILGQNDWGLMAQWEEYQRLDSLEAKLVHDADRLDRYLQAVWYEEQTGNLRLQEFWQKEPELFFPISIRLYELLRARRQRIRSGEESDLGKTF